MIGIENGTAYEHTVALLRSHETSAEDQAMLRVIPQGKTITKDRMAHATIKEAIKKATVTKT